MNDRALQVERQLEQLLANHLEGSADLSSDTHLVRDLGLESVQVMEYVVDIEDEFDLSIDLKSLADVHTLGDMAAAVVRAMES